MSEDTLPEADRAPGAPHPRETAALLGQQAAEDAFLTAYNAGRLHHGWLITGPSGVGKATLAWRIARFLLATPPAEEGGGLFGDTPAQPASLDIPPDHPVSHRMEALSEPGLCLIRRSYDQKASRLRNEITVDDVRRLADFFHMSATDGGRRVVIVDAADEMNTSAANAILKLLEEPPKNAVLLLISHQPSRLLPTIRSRCRELRCRTLEAAAMAPALEAAGAAPEADPAALAELSGGSVGAALRLSNQEGMALYSELIGLFETLPRLDRPRALKLAESCVGAANRERYEMTIRLIDLFLARLARTGAGRAPMVEAAKGEATLMKRLAPSRYSALDWAELQQLITARAEHGRAVNLDPAALILDMVLKINETAAKVPA